MDTYQLPVFEGGLIPKINNVVFGTTTRDLHDTAFCSRISRVSIALFGKPK